MKNPSDQTVQTYRENFVKYLERTPGETLGEFQEWLDSFASHIPREGAIFEIGSASGRDARYFAAQGFTVLCTDIVPEALQRLSSEGFETAEYDFRDAPNSEWVNGFDGVFANATLLHALPDVFENALRNISLLLRRNGVAALSLKTGEGEEISLEKMDAPRYFRYYTELKIREIFSGLPYEVIDVSHAENGKWLHIIVKVQK